MQGDQGKKDYVQKIEKQIEDWASKIDELKAKGEQAQASVKVEYARRVEALQAKQAALQSKVEEMRGAGEEAWASLKTGVEQAASDLKSALDAAMQKLK